MTGAGLPLGFLVLLMGSVFEGLRSCHGSKKNQACKTAFYIPVF